MSILKKRRNSFDYKGRKFSWWIENDQYLRIASVDKQFIVAVAIGYHADDTPSIKVIGKEFPGTHLTERPLWFEIPEFPIESMGKLVEQVLEWSFTLKDELKALDGPPTFP